MHELPRWDVSRQDRSVSVLAMSGWEEPALPGCHHVLQLWRRPIFSQSKHDLPILCGRSLLGGERQRKVPGLPCWPVQRPSRCNDVFGTPVQRRHAQLLKQCAVHWERLHGSQCGTYVRLFARLRWRPVSETAWMRCDAVANICSDAESNTEPDAEPDTQSYGQPDTGTNSCTNAASVRRQHAPLR